MQNAELRKGNADYVAELANEELRFGFQMTEAGSLFILHSAF